MKETSHTDSVETPAEASAGAEADNAGSGLYPAPGSWIRLCIYTLIVGLATGLGAAGLALIMHGIEYAVYGQHEGDVAVVTDGTTGLQRFVGIVLAGLIAGPVWAALRTKATPIESVEAGMNGRLMPVWSTLVNVFLQMATVAAGASMGRENAPRELGAMVASQMSHRLRIDPLHRRILVAAAAGAGLGAIYHIPLAGAVFSLEILLGSLSITAVMVVLACSAIATVTSGIVVGSSPLYSPINLSDGWGNLGAALLIGVICGAIGYAFRILSSRMSDTAPTGWHSAWAIPLAFTLVGVISLCSRSIGQWPYRCDHSSHGPPAAGFCSHPADCESYRGSRYFPFWCRRWSLDSRLCPWRAQRFHRRLLRTAIDALSSAERLCDSRRGGLPVGIHGSTTFRTDRDRGVHRPEFLGLLSTLPRWCNCDADRDHDSRLATAPPQAINAMEPRTSSRGCGPQASRGLTARNSVRRATCVGPDNFPDTWAKTAEHSQARR